MGTLSSVTALHVRNSQSKPCCGHWNLLFLRNFNHHTRLSHIRWAIVGAHLHTCLNVFCFFLLLFFLILNTSNWLRQTIFCFPKTFNIFSDFIKNSYSKLFNRKYLYLFLFNVIYSFLFNVINNYSKIINTFTCIE